jgi:hypothetical protein
MNLSTTTLLFMIFWDVQCFIINMMIGLMYETQYFEFMTLAAVSYFYGVIVKMRLAFTVFRL